MGEHKCQAGRRQPRWACPVPGTASCHQRPGSLHPVCLRIYLCVQAVSVCPNEDKRVYVSPGVCVGMGGALRPAPP